MTLHSLFLSWRDRFDPVLLELLLASFAVLCGAILGSERQRREKPAGLRTLILVCLGSGTFTQVSVLLAAPNGDPTRIAAQIVTGIGFLGAGAILRGRTGVTGMTTAATIWMTAAIGMVVGAGHPLAGLGLSFGVRAALGIAAWWEQQMVGGFAVYEVQLEADSNGGKTRLHIDQIVADFEIPALAPIWEDRPDGKLGFFLKFRLARRHRTEFLAELSSIAAVNRINAKECTD
jgi:putative Mg2+ transporter-C (MgtC) family protein